MSDSKTKGLDIIDWVLFASLLVVSSGIGVYSALRGRGNHSTSEYLLGGRKMSAIPVAMSLVGGVVSAVSILGLPAETYFFGTQLSLSVLGIVYGLLIVQQLILPILYPLKILSINEYITMRYGSKTLKNLGASVLILASFMYMGMCLYAPALSLSTVTGISPYVSIAVMGLVCTSYITIGGVKAVVNTDVLQILIMFLGIIVTVVICVLDLNGIAVVFDIANAGGRLEFFNMNPDPFIRHTFWSAQVMGTFQLVYLMGLNQPGYMRFASVPSISIAKRICIYFVIGNSGFWLLFYFTGIVAYATYRECDPMMLGMIEKPDQILPYLVMDKLSKYPGMMGLFSAAIYGGVLSSVSSYGNSAASLLWQDFLQDMVIFRGISDKNATRVLQVLSVVAGLLGTGFGMLVGQLGNVAQVAFSITGALAGPISGLFLGGMCLPWVNLKGAYAGFTSAIVFTFWLTIGQFIKGIGSPENLPLSVEGCSEISISNTSVVQSNHTFHSSTPVDRAIYSTEGNDEFVTPYPFDGPIQTTERGFYHLSYCYTCVMGIIVFFTISTMVSLITGPSNPHKMDPRLVSPRCLQFSKWLWQSFQRSETQDISI